MANTKIMNKKETSALSQWITENRKASVERERIRAANRERVAQIRAVAQVYCAQVDERIAKDTNETACRVAGANVAIASAQMVAQVVRARCDESIARITERTDQFLSLSTLQKEMHQALAMPGLSPEDREWLMGEIRQLRQDQAELKQTAENEACRLPPMVVPMRFLSHATEERPIQEECS